MKSKKNNVFFNLSYLSLWGGELISEFGGAIGALCNSLLLYQITGSKAAMGTLWLVYFIPSLVLQLFAGPFIDMISRKKLMVISQVLRGVVFLLPAFLMYIGTPHVWPLFVIQIILGIVQPLYVPASLALLPTIVSKDQLIQANAYLDGVLRLMGFLAPPIGGIVISIISIKWTYLAVGLLFFLSSISLLNLKEKTLEKIERREPWLKLISSGYVYFFKRKSLLWLGIFTAFVQFGVGVTMVINVPFIIDELEGNSFTYGLFMAGFPLGYFFGSLLVSRFTKFAQKKTTMLMSLFMGGASFVALSVLHSLPLAIITEALSGMFFPFFNAQSVTLYQKTVPNEHVGKVFSVRLLIIRSTMPLGVLFAGQFADVLGVRYIYLLAGGMICLLAILALVLPYFNFLNNEAETYPNDSIAK